MRITLWGAAGEVTGSSYGVQTERARLLVDFGMFQGGKRLEALNRIPNALNVAQLDAVVLTHAHVDHVGRLPLLAQRGYRKPVFATQAAIEMANLILRDTAKVQAMDAEQENRRRQRARLPLIAPPYDISDVEAVLRLLRPVEYGARMEIAPGVAVRLVDAGHMLGSASVEMTVAEGGRRKVAVFSGDIGPRGAPWLRDPTPLDGADLVFMESTYGDRDHRSLRETLGELRDVVLRVAAKKGRLVVPAFAVGRSQDIIYHMAALFRDGQAPAFPIYLDSPMAIHATQIYEAHEELMDAETQELMQDGQLEKDMRHVVPTETVDQSKAINTSPGPWMVIAGSGMMNGGRILHHLRHNLWRDDAAILIVGYQAEGTLGRQLVDGAKSVKIFGERIAVQAEVHTLNGFSAHAGQGDLLDWLGAMAPSRPRVVLIHGEDRARQALAQKVQERYGLAAALPTQGETIEV